ncbi:MAG: hypothetical protein LBB55_03840 [Zoogloeaceae bacterium]|nr:hypothetical protein [Zoogloeaceae bacterium]
MRFPVPPAPFSGESRALPTQAALDWLLQGWVLFRQAAGRWALLAIFFLALCVAPAALDARALWGMPLLLPFFAAGWFTICRMESEAEKTAEEAEGAKGEKGKGRRFLPGDLFAGFVSPALFIPGLLTLVMVHLPLACGALFFHFAPFSPDAILNRVLGFCMLLPILFLLCLPLSMALLFAPPLMHQHRLPSLMALKASYIACRKNLAPLFCLAFLSSLIAFATLLSAGLLLPLALPVAFGTWYAAYRDIFVSV